MARPTAGKRKLGLPAVAACLLTLAAAPREALTRTEYNLRAFNPSASEIRDLVLRACPSAAITFFGENGAATPRCCPVP